MYLRETMYEHLKNESETRLVKVYKQKDDMIKLFTAIRKTLEDYGAGNRLWKHVSKHIVDSQKRCVW